MFMKLSVYTAGWCISYVHGEFVYEEKSSHVEGILISFSGGFRYSFGKSNINKETKEPTRYAEKLFNELAGKLQK